MAWGAGWGGGTMGGVSGLAVSSDCGKPSVEMKPGSTSPTCTPCSRSSAHSESDQPASAYFDALYAPLPARATRPAVEETFTIAEGALSRSIGRGPPGHPTRASDLIP